MNKPARQIKSEDAAIIDFMRLVEDNKKLNERLSAVELLVNPQGRKLTQMEVRLSALEAGARTPEERKLYELLRLFRCKSGMPAVGGTTDQIFAEIRKAVDAMEAAYKN